jgi:hypothetical protein
MSKIINYVTQLVFDDSSRYPGVMKMNLISDHMPDPILWANGVLFDDPLHDARCDTHSINLKNL